MRYREMAPSTNEWMGAFRELNAHQELSSIVLHRNGDWTFVAERETAPQRISNKYKVIATTYYKAKIYKTETFLW